MAPQTRRQAAMLVSVHVDPDGNPPWYARLTSYRDVVGGETHSQTHSTLASVEAALRAWLESVIETRGS
jgi:hypothetical protein